MLVSQRLLYLLLAVACALFWVPSTSSRLLSQEEPAEEADAPADAPADPAPADGAAGDDAPADAVAADDSPNQYWVIEFEHQAVRMIAPRTGLGTGKVYWYMLYTLTNTSKEDHDVYVQISARSDHDRTYTDLMLPNIEKAIERKENVPLWGKVDQFEVSRKRKPSDPKYNYFALKAGEKKRCVAVFNRLDPNANEIVIHVAGLSNEIREVVKEDGTRHLESRIRELRFARPGDEHEMTLDSFKLVGKSWIKQTIGATRPVTAGAAAAPARSGASREGTAPEGN